MLHVSCLSSIRRRKPEAAAAPTKIDRLLFILTLHFLSIDSAAVFAISTIYSKSPSGDEETRHSCRSLIHGSKMYGSTILHGIKFDHAL